MTAMADRDAVLNALKVVVDPDLRKDIVTLGFVKDVHIEAGRVKFTIELTTPACPVPTGCPTVARRAWRPSTG